MAYTNDKGETIESSAYVTAKYKELFSKNGAEVFKSIQNDKNLTPEERQQACLAIGKAATRRECQIAKNAPETLMRGDSGHVQFVAAYIKANAKGYLDAVTEKAKLAIQNPDLNGHDIGKDIIAGFTSELPKLSKDAAEFLQVTSGVVQTELPDHAEQLTARILVNNMNLRGANTAVTVWLKAFDPENKKALDKRSEVQQNNEKAWKPLAEHGTAVANAKNNIEKFQKELDVTVGDLERRVVQQNLDREKQALIKAQTEYDKEFEVHKANIEKVKKEGELALAPFQDRLGMIDRGMQANNDVLTAVNHIDGFTAGDHVEDGELDVNTYKGTLSKIATGKVPGQEITTQTKLPEVDMKGVQEAVDLENKAKAKLAGEQDKVTQASKRQAEKDTFGVAQQKAAPELAEITALEKKIDQINYARQLKTNPGLVKVDAEGKPLQAYKPTIGERFKAFFSKGGMDEVLRQKREQTTDQVDKLKMKVQLKTDPDFVGEVKRANEVGTRLLKEAANDVERESQFYRAAQQQVYDASHDLIVDQALRKSNLPGLTPERRQELLKLKSDGEAAMLKYEGSHLKFEQLEQQRGLEVKNTSVRTELQQEKEALEKAQSQTVGNNQGAKVQQTPKTTAKLTK